MNETTSLNNHSTYPALCFGVFFSQLSKKSIFSITLIKSAYSGMVDFYKQNVCRQEAGCKLDNK